MHSSPMPPGTFSIYLRRCCREFLTVQAQAMSYAILFTLSYIVMYYRSVSGTTNVTFWHYDWEFFINCTFLVQKSFRRCHYVTLRIPTYHNSYCDIKAHRIITNMCESLFTEVRPSGSWKHPNVICWVQIAM